MGPTSGLLEAACHAAELCLLQSGELLGALKSAARQLNPSQVLDEVALGDDDLETVVLALDGELLAFEGHASVLKELLETAPFKEGSDLVDVVAHSVKSFT